MKKFLSILLSFVLILGTVFVIPVVSVSAESVTAASFTDGVTWGLSEGGNIDYLRLTSDWGSFTGANGSVTITDPNSCRSTMANVTGFTAGTTYQVTFSATGISNVYAVLNYDSAYFDVDQIVRAKSGCESDLVSGTVSNGVATISFAPTSGSIYLIVKNNAGTVTLSDFAITIINPEDSEGNAIANGDWYITKNAGGTVTKANNTVNFTGAQYQTMYTKLTGLTANTTYKLTFDVSPTLDAQVWLLSADAELSFIIDGTVPANATNIGSVNGITVTAEFTAEEDSYYILFRNSGTSGATTAFTFSNFKLKATQTIPGYKLLGNKIADGEWLVTGGGTVEQNKTAHTITADTTYHCAYTTVTGLQPNTKYSFTCNYDLEGLYTVYFVNSSIESPIFNDSVYTDNCPDIAQNISITDGTLQFDFITDEFNSSYTLILKHIEQTSGAVTYSNFSVENMGEYSIIESNAEIQNADWQYSVGSIQINNDGSVTAKTPWHFLYTKLPTLPRNALVKIEIDFTEAGNTVESLYIVSASEEFTVDGSTGSYSGTQTNIATYSIENGKITAYFKTSTGRSGYYLGLKHGSLSSSGITYSNFNIEIVDNISSVAASNKGNDILDSDDWAIEYSTNGKLAQDKTNHTLTQSGNSYQDIATTLKGLKTNATYTISVNYTENDNIGGVYVYPTSVAKWSSNANIATRTTDEENYKTTITFNTDSQNTEYYLHFRHGVLENGDITYSNMQIKTENIIFDEDIRGAKIADGEWSAEIPGNVSFSHNYITHTLTQGTNGYQRIFTKVDFLQPNTEYEFTANYTTDDIIQAVYFAPAEQELDFSSLSQYSVAYTKTNGVLNFSFMTSAKGSEYYLIIYHGKLSDNEITYSNFKLRANQTWSNEEQGALLAQNEWKTTSSSAYVTTDTEAKTVTTNATSNYIYVQITGLSLNTSYRITCSYTGNDSDISAVYIGGSEEFPFSNSSLDWLYNKATSMSFKNNYLTVNFKTTGSNSNYWLAIKQSSNLSDGSITYSDFKVSIPGVTTVNDEFSEWTSPSSTAFYTISANAVTASATSGSIYTKISGLEYNTTYSLQLTHTALDGIKQLLVFPASESLTRSAYWLNGYYNGKYVNYSYSTTVFNNQNATANIVFSTDDTYSNYYLVVELKNGTSVTLSDWELSKFTDLGFVGTAVRRAQPYVKQALRYKNTISATAFENGCFGLDIKEFGSIAADTSNLNGMPLVMNDNMTVSNAAVKKGVAYNADTSKIFETLSDGTKIFTAALINIASDKYSVNYTVRPYIILTDGTNDYTVYGKEQIYSVFTVFSLIEIYGSGEDSLTVYDILDKKPEVNAKYYEFKGLNNADIASLSVYNNTVLSNDYKGLSGTVYHSSGYITNDVTGRNYTDEQRAIELKRLSESGVKYCRTRFSPKTIWSSSNGKFDFSSLRMQNFISYCKALESKDISVCIQTSWYLNEILDNNQDNAANAYLNGNGVDLYSEQALYSGLIATEYKLSGNTLMSTGETLTEYYNRVGIAAVRYGVYLSNFIKAAKDSGVNNIDYLIYFTEPSYATADKPEGEYANEYLFVSKTIRNVIEQTGYASGVKHVGPNQGSVTTGLGLLKYVVTREPDLFDVLTAHFYPYSSSISDDVYYKQCVNTFSSYLQVLKDAGVEGKEFWVDEFFAVQQNSSRIARQSAMAALQTIVGAISAQQLGVENIVLWQLFDQAWGDTNETSTEFENGIHMCGTAPSLLVSDIPYAAYYPLSTFMRFNSANSGKSFATSSGTNATAQGIYVGAMEDDDGNIVITVVNLGSSERIFNLNLENALGKNLYRYSVSSKGINPTCDANSTACSRIVNNVGSVFTDTVLPYSVSIYTTSVN